MIIRCGLITGVLASGVRSGRRKSRSLGNIGCLGISVLTTGETRSPASWRSSDRADGGLAEYKRRFTC